MFRRCATITCSLVFVLTSAAQAVEHPAELFSQDVSFVIRLKSPETTTTNVSDFAEAINPGFGQLITAQAPSLGIVISNPTLAGVDQSRDWWLGVFSQAQNNPALVFVVPAKDLNAMQAAVEATGMTFLAHQSWGIYSSDSDIMANVQARIDGKTAAVVESVDDTLRETFEKGDLSLFVNVPQLVKVFDADITRAKQELQSTLDNARERAGSMADFYTELATPLFHALDDTTGVVVTLGVNKQGAAIEALAKAQENSPTAKLLQWPTSDDNVLARLPAGGQAYFSMSKFPALLREWSITVMETSAQLSGEDETADAIDKVKEVMRRMQKLDMSGTSGMIAVSTEGAAAGVQSASVMDISQPQQMRLLTKELVAAQSGLNINGVETTYELKEDAETVGELKIDTLKVEQEFEQNPFFDLQKITSVFLGEEGMLTRIAYTDKQIAQTLGGGKEAMAELLKRLDLPEPPPLSPELQATRNALSKNANLVGLIDLPGTLSRMARLVLNSGLFGLPIAPEAISIPETASFLGLSFATEPQGARVKIYLPAVQAKNSYQLGLQVYQTYLDLQGQQF